MPNMMLSALISDRKYANKHKGAIEAVGKEGRNTYQYVLLGILYASNPMPITASLTQTPKQAQGCGAKRPNIFP